MNQGQGTVLRSGRVIDSSSEIESPADPDMAQANSNDSDTNDNSDISSQLSEIKESYERRINELHQEFSQLKDLMMAIVSKNNNESQPSSSKGPSKPAQQHGFDNNESQKKNILAFFQNPYQTNEFYSMKSIIDFLFFFILEYSWNTINK